MKLRFDQNLSYKLCARLSDCYPDSAHVRLCGLDTADDRAVWHFAGQHGYAIVTLDADFAALAAWLGPPPKIIWLRCGNQPTRTVEDLLRRHADAVERFGADPASACLEAYA